MASIERALADSIKTSVAGSGYISANSIPVRHWDDNETARVMPCVLVRVSPRELIMPGYPYHKMIGTVTVCHHRDDDPNAAVADLIYDAVADWQLSTLTASLLSVDGIVKTEGTEEVEESIHFRGVSFEIYESIT